MKNWLRLLLPGVFAEVHHWRVRAELAEARLGEVIGQWSVSLEAERQEKAQLQKEILDLLRGNIPMPSPATEDTGGLARSSPPVYSANPIARAISEDRQRLANNIPDDVVDVLTDEYLKRQALGQPVEDIFDFSNYQPNNGSS